MNIPDLDSWMRITSITGSPNKFKVDAYFYDVLQSNADKYMIFTLKIKRYGDIRENKIKYPGNEKLQQYECLNLGGSPFLGWDNEEFKLVGRIDNTTNGHIIDARTNYEGYIFYNNLETTIYRSELNDGMNLKSFRGTGCEIKVELYNKQNKLE